MKKVIFWLILAFFAVDLPAQQFQVLVDSSTRYLQDITFNGNTSGYASCSAGYWKTVNGGQNWQAVSTAMPGFYFKLDFPSPGVMVTSGENGRIGRSTNNGLNWTFQQYGSVELLGLDFSNTLTGYAVGMGSTVLKTTNGGVSWNNQTIPPTDAYLSDVLCYGDNVFMTAKGPATNLLKSTNAGLTWFDAKVGEGTQGGFDICNNGDKFYMVGREDNGGWHPVIFTSTNGGGSWEKKSFSFPGRLTKIAVSPSNPLNAMAIGQYLDDPQYGNGPLILRTTDGGLNWTVLHWGNTSTIVNGVEATDSEYFLVGSGFIIKTAQVVSVNQLSTIVENYSLKQNFPNPFNPSTTIRFSVARNTRVSLSIWDASGRHIAELADNESVSAGSYEYVFDAKGLASGVYFYTLKTDGFTDTKKMLLAK